MSSMTFSGFGSTPRRPLAQTISADRDDEQQRGLLEAELLALPDRERGERDRDDEPDDVAGAHRVRRVGYGAPRGSWLGARAVTTSVRR